MFLLFVLPLTAVLVPSASSQAFCEGGKLEKSVIETNVLNIINKRRSKLAKGKITDDPSTTAAGGTTPVFFPAASLMNKLAWDCELETKALAALGTCDSPGTLPTGSTENAEIYWGDTSNDDYPMSVVIATKWLDQISGSSLDTTGTANEVHIPATAAGGITNIKEFANLMRYDTHKIGCAELSCTSSTGDQTLVYCLTDQKSLDDGDKLYDSDTSGKPCNGGCEKGAAPNTQCDEDMGLCEEPVVSTTAASTTAESTTAASTAATTGVTTAAETTTEASYPGELPTGTNSMCPDHDGMTDELRMHFLDTQNYRRSILAKGQVPRPSGNLLPQGANIIKLTNSCPLEWEAIKEVRQCPTMKAKSTGYGKNFDTFASSTATSTFRDAIKKAVTNWWKVSRTEREGPGVNAVTFREWHVDAPVATYTQIAWANTREIGCAIAKCSSSYTVICLYDPAGNIPEEPMYKIGAPGTACPSGTTPDSALGLCVQN